MRSKSIDEVTTIKSFVDNIIQKNHNVAYLILKSKIDDVEIIVFIKHIEVFYYLLVGDIALRETCSLIKDRESITHTTICFLCDDVESLLLILYVLFLSNSL